MFVFPDIALAYLLRHSQVFRLVPSSSSIISQPQTTFIKAIRTHASHLIDVRLIIPSSSSSTFPRNNLTQWIDPHIQTGYELKRKESSYAISNLGKKEWDALTIYMVCSAPFQMPLSLTISSLVNRKTSQTNTVAYQG